jgi:hypothetical protein
MTMTGPAPAPAAASVELGAVELPEPDVLNRSATELKDAEGDWLCAWCHNRVANERDRFRYDGKDQFAFSNPAGICFVILTFSQVIGCKETGSPTLENTWFPGYAWSYCLCDRCGQHLGWYYTGERQFAGLIQDRIVRAIGVRN